MPAGPVQDIYTRRDARRLARVTERQLKSWEKQRLVPALEEYALPDLIALTSLKKLLANRVSTVRVRKAVEAIREKLRDVENPLKELKIVCEGRNVAVVVDGQKMEPVSGQLLLNFDQQALAGLLAFPGTQKRAEQDAAAIRKREAEHWFEEGLDLEQTGAPPEDIIAAYRHALDFDPESAAALVNLGTIYYHLQDWPNAERCYRDAIRVDNTYALAHFNLGNLYDENGRRSDAARCYRAAIAADGAYADAHYNLALLCQANGDTMEAASHWQAYLKLDRASSWALIAKRELEKLRRATVLTGKRESGGSQG